MRICSIFDHYCRIWVDTIFSDIFQGNIPRKIRFAAYRSPEFNKLFYLSI